MTSRPPIALVKRDTHLFVAGVLDAPGDDGLLRVAFVGQGRPHQAYLAGLSYGPLGEGDTYELAAQALVEKLQTDTLDFPAFLLSLAEGAQTEASDADGDDLDIEALESTSTLLRTLAGLSAQEHRDEQIANMLVALDDPFADFDIHRQRLAEAMFDAGWRFTGGRRDGPG